MFRKFSRRSMRSSGDKARDEGKWGDAEKFYKDYLKAVPNDVSILIQCGHALKEQGKLSESLDYYKRASVLKPNDSDAHLQLGHILKLLDRESDSIEAYRRSFELSPAAAAAQELEGRGIDESSEVPVRRAASSKDATLIEVDDLLLFLKHHDTLTGIQRTVANICLNLIALSGEGEEEKFVFVHNSLGTNSGRDLWEMQASDLTSLIRDIGRKKISQAEIKRRIEIAESRSIRLLPQAGQTYLVLGAFWYGGAAARHIQLKKMGLIIGVYIYDLIPLTHPEYTTAGLTHEFSMQLANGFRIYDFIMTISEYVEKEVRRLIRDHGLQERPVVPVPLAHMLDSDTKKNVADVWSDSISHLRDVPFVLVVSTIEIRKNHILLVRLWQKFIKENLDPPDLVFVGRYGWSVEPLRELLQSTGNLRGKVHILHGITDDELNVLYRNCRYTAFPSFVEGWGLPVGEALSHGQICAASNTSSIPEVGGTFAEYFSPWNFEEAKELFLKLNRDDDYLRRRKDHIRSNFSPRTWGDVATQLVRVSKDCAAASGLAFNEVALKSSALFKPADFRFGRDLPLDYMSRPLREVLAHNWYGAEETGAWMHGHEGLIRFRTDATSNDIVVFLILKPAPGTTDQFCEVFVGDRRTAQKNGFVVSVSLAGEHSRIVRIKGSDIQDRVVQITVRYHGQPARMDGDPRSFGVGLVAMSHAAVNDQTARQEAFENISMELSSPGRS